MVPFDLPSFGNLSLGDSLQSRLPRDRRITAIATKTMIAAPAWISGGLAQPHMRKGEPSLAVS